MNYIEELEKQNEELQQRLAQAELWEPRWVKLPFDTGKEEWNLTNKFWVHARIIFNMDGKYMYYVKMLNRDQVEHIDSTLEGAKEAAMRKLSDMRIKRDLSGRRIDQ